MVSSESVYAFLLFINSNFRRSPGTGALIILSNSTPYFVVISCYSGGGTCQNCALGDTSLNFCMVLGQTIRFSKTTGYKFAHASAVACGMVVKIAKL